MHIVVTTLSSQTFYLLLVRFIFSWSGNHPLSAPPIVYQSSLRCVHSIQILVMALSFVFLLLLPLLAKGSQRLPDKMLGMYINLADNGIPGQEVLFPKDSNIGPLFIRYHDESDWNPLLFPYQQTGANVLYFTFIDPSTMLVPLSFRKLGNDRKSCQIKSTAFSQQ